VSQLRRVPACLLASATLTVSSLALAAPPPESTDSALPSWNDAPIVTPEEPLSPTGPDPLPSDGRGSMTAGAMLLGGGVILTASSSVLLYEDSDETGLWIAGAAVGSVAIAAGMGLLISGAVKRKRYEPWRLQHRPPPQGNGLFAGGALALSAGAFALLLGGVSLPLQDADDLPYGQVVLSLGAVSIATGVALVVVGSKRARAFNAWNNARVLPTFGVLANPQLRTASATFGIAGRF
jgi:hypothetical protein